MGTISQFQLIEMQRRISANTKRVKDCEVVKYEPCDDEGGLHEEIIRTCRANGWYFQHDRMFKKNAFLYIH